MRWTDILPDRRTPDTVAVKKNSILGLLFAALLACGSEGVTLSPLPVSSTVLAFGDSLTAGYGASVQQSFPTVLADIAVLNVINAGISGELSAEGLRRLPALLQQHKPRLVVLCHGGNDLLQSRGNGAAKANILAMVELIRSSGAEVLLLGVPQPGVFLSTAEIYHEIAEETGVAYIPDLLEEILSDSALKSDTVHPNAAGYQLLASGIHSYLLRSGAL